MPGPENTFIASVRRHLPRTLYAIKNNNQYNAGQPDLWFSGRGGDLWVEAKFVKLPARDATAIEPGLSELQKHWLRGRHAEGRNVGVMIGAKEGGIWLPGITWDRILSTGEVKTMLVDRRALAYIIATACGEPRS